MNLDYIAGFFDGEGSISVTVSHGRGRGKYGYMLKYSIGISQETPMVLQQIRDFLGFGRLYKVPTQYTIYTLNIAGLDDAFRFCDLMHGKLVVKKQQLDVMSQILEIRREHGRSTIGQGFSRDGLLKQLDLAEQLWFLNGQTTTQNETIARARKAVLEFDEQAYIERVKKHVEKLNAWTRNPEIVRRRMKALNESYTHDHRVEASRKGWLHRQTSSV